MKQTQGVRVMAEKNFYEKRADAVLERISISLVFISFILIVILGVLLFKF